MDIIDQYAYANRLRTLDPAGKAGLALLVLLLCLLLERPAVGLLAAGWMWGLATFWAGLPGRLFGRVLLAEAIFLSLAATGVAISFSTTPQADMDWRWQLGPVWLASSRTMLGTALQLVTRALGGAAAMNFLALTTPLVDLIDLLQRLRVPAVLIDLTTVVYRFIFVLLDSLNRIYTAQASRLGYANFRRSLYSAALLSSRLFLEAYQRSRRLQIALESRGLSGDLRVLPQSYRRDWRLLWLGGVIAASLLLAWRW